MTGNNANAPLTSPHPHKEKFLWRRLQAGASNCSVMLRHFLRMAGLFRSKNLPGSKPTTFLKNSREPQQRRGTGGILHVQRIPTAARQGAPQQ